MDKIQLKNATSGAVNDIEYLISCKFLENSFDWTCAWYEHDLKWSDGSSGYLTIPEHEVEPFAKACQSNYEVWKLAKYFAGTRLEYNVEVPQPIKNVIVTYLKGEGETPPKKTGRRDFKGRDFIIVRVMRMLLDSYEIQATANRHPLGKRIRTKSASAIISEASFSKVLSETKIGEISEERISKIWGSTAVQERHDLLLGLHLKSHLDDLPFDPQLDEREFERI